VEGEAQFPTDGPGRQAGKKGQQERWKRPVRRGPCDLAPTVSTPNPDALAIRGWVKNGSEDQQSPHERVSSQTMRKEEIETPNFQKSRLPKVDLPSEPALPNCLREGAIVGKGGCGRGTSPFKSGDLEC
jgi:hypothetical protein